MATTIAPALQKERLVRPANLLDIEPIARIHNQYVDGGPYTMEDDHWTPMDVRGQLDHFTNREGYLVCDDDDIVVGWGKVKHYSPRAGYAIACEMSTYVDRESRGGGIGHALMSELIALSRRMGYHHAVARIIASNQASMNFHFKHGFELVGVQREIGMVDGQLADVAILQRVD